MPTLKLPRPDSRLTIAVVAGFLWHGGLLLAGSYQRTYDAWIHMFFGDHYARDWFSTWETRWYTGFTVTSYPPGTHQLIALLSKGFGLEGAFIIIQLTSVLLLIIGVYRFSQIWVSRRAAGWAAVLAMVSTSIAEVVHVFGQLPTSFSLAILLNTLPSIFAWVARNSWKHLIVAICGLAATTAGHHVTTLFGAVFFVGPVLATALLDALRTPLPGEKPGHSSSLRASNWWPVVARRLRRVLPVTVRCAVIGLSAIGVLVTVVLPYWLWSSSDPIVQIPIPHATRDNFVENTAAGIVFFVVPWGFSIIFLPFALIRGALSRALPLAASAGLLFVLGTGGTTPIPRMLLRGAFDILTLDRFTVWATIAILPLMGAIVTSLVSGQMRRFIIGWFGSAMWRSGLIMSGAMFLLAAVLAANFAQFRPLQPDQIDPSPIAEFMTKDQHDRWRYLTLGFGDQMAIVSASMTATTVDGNYHSARRLPELTSRSVERLEGAKFRGVPGIGSLQQFLATPERYNLKFVFSNDSFYDPLLWASGWHRLDRLQNGVVVWEREDIPPLPDVLPVRELPNWQRAMWGSLPMTAVAMAIVAFSWLAVGQPIGRRVHRAANAIGRRSRRLAVARIYAWFDRLLGQAADRMTTGEARTPWVGALRAKLSQRFAPPDAPPRWAKAAVAGIGLVAAASVAWLAPAAAESTPEQAVAAYYDDLDFRRFAEAWDRLESRSRPSLAQYQLELSVEDGLVASYGKLDALELETVSRADGLAVVEAELRFITPLVEYTVERRHELQLVHDEWKLIAPPSDVSTTPDQFARSTDVNYLSQGRRQVTTEQTLFGDVLDRPRIATLSASAIKAAGRYAVVGEITNLDVDPADLTVTARFIDADGETLVEHNASLVSIHKVLPRETVPFRIDLEAIAGDRDPHTESAGDFHPDLFAAPDIEVGDIASIEVATKAVVTGRDLERSLQAQHLKVGRGADGSVVLRGQLRNTGTTNATVPHVLVTLIRPDGTVGWVDHHWVEQAVRPQRTKDFELTLTSADSLQQLDVPLKVFGNGINAGEGQPFQASSVIELPADSGWKQAHVTVHAFHRPTS